MKITSFTLIFSLLLTATACIKTPRPVGYSFNARQVEDITIGKTTREGVTAILGSPSTVSDYGQPSWFYIYNNYEQVAFLDPKLTEQKILKITFDGQGVVSEKAFIDKDKARQITMNNDKTPITASDMTITQQLLGNIGRFNNNSPLSSRHRPGNTQRQ